MSDKIIIGKVTGSFGVRGEVKVYSYSGFSDRFDDIPQVEIGGRTYSIRGVKKKPKLTVLSLEGVEDKDGAEALRGKEVYMQEEDLRPLPQDQYYIRDMVGMEVRSQGEPIGVLKEVLTDRPQDVYVVELNEGGSCMIPAVKEFIKQVDIQNKVMEVSLIEGMVRP